ncbi:MAG TPA: YdjY domain-containing protein [Pirellulales bacterium]|nr:YdjY domain-containing protein [Pirellulales bacterium]
MARLVVVGALAGAASSAIRADETPSATAEDQPALVPLDPKARVWIDKAQKRVVMVGKVCLRQGQLEMFACPEGTKEHESVLSVPVAAEKVHAALLAVDAAPGRPVQFQPKYRGATGSIIDVSLYWTDDAGKRRSAWAQDWVQDSTTGKALDQPWVFAGSGFWRDEQTGKESYMANQGELICVSNFPSAMLDLPIESSDKAGQLLFNAFTERIPPIDTPVTIVLTPRPAQEKKE